MSYRSIGLEQEFFLVEESGEPSVQADEFLERCRERSEREGDGGAACLAPEWVRGVVEINTPPVRSLADLEGEYANNVRLALRSAQEIGLRLYPLGTYPLPLEPAVREEPDYQVQVLTSAPRGSWTLAGAREPTCTWGCRPARWTPNPGCRPAPRRRPAGSSSTSTTWRRRSTRP